MLTEWPVSEMGWSDLDNGALLDAATTAGFELFITTDKNVRHQQNLAQAALAILVLPTTSWPTIQQHVTEVVAAVQSIQPGQLQELTFTC